MLLEAWVCSGSPVIQGGRRKAPATVKSWLCVFCKCVSPSSRICGLTLHHFGPSSMGSATPGNPGNTWCPCERPLKALLLDRLLLTAAPEGAWCLLWQVGRFAVAAVWFGRSLSPGDTRPHSVTKASPRRASGMGSQVRPLLGAS